MWYMVEVLHHMVSPYSKFEFYFPVTLLFFLKLSQFLNHWEAADSAFCSEGLSDFSVDFLAKIKTKA